MTISHNRQQKNFNNFLLKHLVKKYLITKKKKEDFYLYLIDTNNDGLVNWTDFEAAIEVIYYIYIYILMK